MVLSIRGRTKCGCKVICFFEKDKIAREKDDAFYFFLIKFTHSYGVITFYLTSMLLRLLVVVDIVSHDVTEIWL